MANVRKLTDLQADLIRAEHASGASQRKLAKKYGTSQMAIWQLLQGKTYRPAETRAA